MRLTLHFYDKHFLLEALFMVLIYGSMVLMPFIVGVILMYIKR